MRAHRRLPMAGRDRHEQGRSATPLELLYDLTFVVAIGLAAHHFAEFVAEGHPVIGIVGFVFAMFAILNAWIDFSWFASAFDTDDWVYRLLVMVQMVGVVMVALGVAPMFHSLEEPGHGLDFRLIAIGYVVMRVALVVLWVRVIVESDEYDVVGRRSVALIVFAQACWLTLALLLPPVLVAFSVIVVLGALEVATPMIAQRRADGTPWHGHHIAERYGLLAIIALGEGVVGTVASSQAALGGAAGGEWDVDAVLILVAGIGLTFGMWWTYFQVPFGDLLHHRPRLGFVFGYGHMPVYMAIAAIGAGLHVAAIQHSEGAHGGHHISAMTVVLSVAIPAALFTVGIVVLETVLLGRPRGLHLAGVAAALVILLVAVAFAQVSVAWALVVVMLASFAPVAGYEIGGYRHQEDRLARLGEADQSVSASRPRL